MERAALSPICLGDYDPHRRGGLIVGIDGCAAHGHGQRQDAAVFVQFSLQLVQPYPRVLGAAVAVLAHVLKRRVVCGGTLRGVPQPQLSTSSRHAQVPVLFVVHLFGQSTSARNPITAWAIKINSDEKKQYVF